MSGPATKAADFYGDFSGHNSDQKFENPYDALLAATNSSAVSNEGFMLKAGFEFDPGTRNKSKTDIPPIALQETNSRSGNCWIRASKVSALTQFC